jgi:glutaredoxin
MMMSTLAEKLRAFAHRKLEGEGTGRARPMVQRVRDLASTVNDLLGKPIRAVDEPPVLQPASHGHGIVAAATPAAPAPAPVLVYFDGKDHRTKAKVEELLRAQEIAFQVLDVSNDEAERSWITAAAKQDEFPIVVIAGAPVGGFAALTQLDVDGELRRRVFGSR